MSVAEPPFAPPAIQVKSNDPVERRNSAAFGVITLVLASLVFLTGPVVSGLVNTAAFIDQASTISWTVVTYQVYAALAVFLLALVAALLRRGTGWAVSAMCISLAGTPFLLIWLTLFLVGRP